MNSLYLTDEETVLLDGKCSAKVQVTVDGAKARLAAITGRPDLPPSIAAFVADVVRLAEKQKALGLFRIALRHCKVCGDAGGYAKFKSGRRRGQDNLDKPTYLQGVDLEISSVTMRGIAGCGCCLKCWETARSHVADAVRDLQVEIPASITGTPPEWKRHQNVRCNDCNWQGHEGQLGMLPAIFGGFYPGQCPSCKTKDLFLGPTKIERIHGEYTVVKAEAKQDVRNGA